MHQTKMSYRTRWIGTIGLSAMISLGALPAWADPDARAGASTVPEKPAPGTPSQSRYGWPEQGSYGWPPPAVPWHGPTEAPPPRRSPGAFKAGLMLIGVGVVGITAAGISGLIYGMSAIGSQGGRQEPALGAFAAGSAIVGLVLVHAGIPLAIYGGGRVSPEQPSKEAWARPQVSVGPTSASLRWSF